MKVQLLFCLAAVCLAGTATAQGPPSNDLRSGAIEFQCGEQVKHHGQQSLLATDDYNPYVDPDAGCTTFDEADPDITTDCADPVGSCVAGDDLFPPPGPETVSYTNPGPGSQTLYLIIDGYNGPPTDAGIGTLTGSITCPPPPSEGDDGAGSDKR